MRQNDPIIGRWTTRDPKNAGYSPYSSMDNNPISKTDPDGGCTGGCFGLLSAIRQAFSNQNNSSKFHSSVQTLRYFKPSVSNPRLNLTLGYGLGSRARLGGLNGTKGDAGADWLHGSLSLGTSGLNFQGTAGSASFKSEHSGLVAGAEGYVFRFNLGYQGNSYDFKGAQYGFGEPYTTNGFIDTDPPTIIDTGLPGLPEIGIDNNYGFGRLFKDFANAIKNYINDIITISPERFEKNND